MGCFEQTEEKKTQIDESINYMMVLFLELINDLQTKVSLS